MTATEPLRVHVAGIGLIAPGLPDWRSAVDVLAGRAPYAAAPAVLPPPAMLPAAERRRASRVVKVALATGGEAVAMAGGDAASLATVFAASGGDGHNCHALCEALASDDRRISPTRFHNSVHNAAAGYWGIATGAMGPCQVLCAYDASFAAGLLEAAVQVRSAGKPVLLVAYDAEYPEPLHATRRIPDAGAVAMVLAPNAQASSIARLDIALTDDKPQPMADGQLEELRRAITPLRALPLLALLARGEPGRSVVEYLGPQHLAVTVTPC
jgi:hypothetical protein